MSESPSIVTFLTARFDEDEHHAQAARGWQTGSRHEGQPLDWSIHMDRWSPDRVLADIAAKRAILKIHTPPGRLIPGYEVEDWQHDQCPQCGYVEKWQHDEYGPTFPCLTVRLLAQPFADADGYDPSWAVEM